MDVFSLLRTGKSRRASDLHMVAGSPAIFRIDGSLTPANGVASLTAEDINEAFLQLTTPEEREHFHRQLEIDFGYTMPDVGRLRCNAAQQRGSISLAVRLLPPKIPTIDELGLPQICKELALKPRGLVIVTGPTGSGKSTTIAAMIHHLNTQETRKVVTIEDPIEYVYPSMKCSVTQRQLGSDTLSFANALKHILRQDPDVILVGEVRDPDTIATVLTAAETGHLVFSTLHTSSAAEAVERIVDVFEGAKQKQILIQLSSVLRAVVSQQLIPGKKGGRVAAREIL